MGASFSAVRAAQVPAGPTVWDGVYTATQADRGAVLFSADCAECHGNKLEGGEGKSLIGTPFMNRWRDETVGELLAYIRKNMPFSDDNTKQGTLPVNTYVDILTFILKSNGFPAGMRDLSPTVGVAAKIVLQGGSDELPDTTPARVVGCLEPREGGDVSRSVGPIFLGADDSVFFQSLNRNKKSLTLDLKHPKGREVLEKLAATADGLLGNLRGDQPEKLRLRHADLAHANPRLVCAHLSAYGRDGSRKSWPGYDYLMQAEAGWLHLSGEPDGPPARMGLSVVDYSTGTTCALALLAGILEARRTGRGRDLDVSLYDVAMHTLNYPAAWHLNEGLQTSRAPRSAHPFIVPSQLYRTRDGWIFVMAQTQGFWELLCDELGREDLKGRYPDFAARRAHRDALTEVLDAEFGKRTADDWVIALRAAEVPVGVVNTLDRSLSDPQVLHRGMVLDIPGPDGLNVRVAGNPLKMPGNDHTTHRFPPRLGQDTLDVLSTELGLTRAEMDTLIKAGVLKAG